MFNSFNTWRSHEMNHRREWFCPLCNVLQHDESKARMHMVHHHGESVGPHEIEMLLQTSSRPSEHLPADDCHFCDWGTTLRDRNNTPENHDLTVPSRRFMKHLGRHLEEIALFVIPQPEEEQRSVNDLASDAAHAMLDGDSATASTLSSFQSQPSSSASVQQQAQQQAQAQAQQRHLAMQHANSQQNNQGQSGPQVQSGHSGQMRPASSVLNPKELAMDSQEPQISGVCPDPTCGRRVENLKYHLSTHRKERPEKCPIVSCEFHTKGFLFKKDKNRHLLTHYESLPMVCGFCPGAGSASEKSFIRMDLFRRHLKSVHGVEQIPPNARRRYQSLSRDTVRGAAGACSACSVVFADAQRFYEHLDDCVERVIHKADPSEEAHTELPRVGFESKEPGYYVAGRVFDVLWTERVAQDTYTRHEWSGEKKQSVVRRFVVVKKEAHHCIALPIYTSVVHGVAVSELPKYEDAIIFNEHIPPLARHGVPGFGGFAVRPDPIRVVPDDALEIGQVSRVDFGGVYMFQYNIEIRSVGRVHDDSMTDFKQRFHDFSVAPATDESVTSEADVVNKPMRDEVEDEDIPAIEVSESESGSVNQGYDSDSGDSREYDSGREMSEIPNEDSDDESQGSESEREVQEYDESEGEVQDDESDGEIEDVDTRSDV